MNEKKATTRPPDRRGVPKSQIRAERRQRAARKKKIFDKMVWNFIASSRMTNQTIRLFQRYQFHLDPQFIQ